MLHLDPILAGFVEKLFLEGVLSTFTLVSTMQPFRLSYRGGQRGRYYNRAFHIVSLFKHFVTKVALKIPGIIMFFALVVLHVFNDSKHFLTNPSASLTATCNSSTLFSTVSNV